MHANLSVTDGVYGILSGMDVKGEIAELGKKIQSSKFDDVEELKLLIKLLLPKLT